MRDNSQNDDCCLLPEPILFHPLKHHLIYIRQYIAVANTMGFDKVSADLLTIGNSQLDLYTGQLTPAEIGLEVKTFLEEKEIYSPVAYKSYLAQDGSDFSLVSLSDGSEWVLRWGLVKDRYVHLHPARYSQHTLRVKATLLKTAIAALIFSDLTSSAIDLHLISSARREWLGLPPVKELSGGLKEMILFLKPL